MTSIFSEKNRTDPQDFLSSIHERLRSARGCADIGDLFAGLHWTDIEARFDARPLMEDMPDLSDRFRGALGRALERRADDPLPWALLFGPYLQSENGNITRPFIVRATRIRNEIICLVRLFGFADCWAIPVQEALREAGQHGIALRMQARQRVSLPLIETSMRSWFWVPASWSRPSLEVRTSTPLILRHQQNVVGSLDSFHRSCVRRLLAIANWCDLQPDAIMISALNQAAWSISDVDLRPVSWLRRSSTHPAGRCHTGFMGRFLVGTPNTISRDLLKTAVIFGAGGGTTSGNGQIDVF